jgi:hypothetical protein
VFDQVPEPIDLELDLANRVLYWTDRGDPPRGNTVNRAPIDKKAVPEILIAHLMEGIGIALDVHGNRMLVTDFAGSIYSADLDRTVVEVRDAHVGPIHMTGLRIHDDAVEEMAIGNDGLQVGVVEIHRVNAVAAQFGNEQAPDRGLGAG